MLVHHWQAIDEEDDEDEEEDEENAQKGALMHERRAQSAGVLGVAAAAMGGELKRHDEPTHADLLRMLLEVEVSWRWRMCGLLMSTCRVNWIWWRSSWLRSRCDAPELAAWQRRKAREAKLQGVEQIDC